MRRNHYYGHSWIIISKDGRLARQPLTTASLFFDFVLDSLITYENAGMLEIPSRNIRGIQVHCRRLGFDPNSKGGNFNAKAYPPSKLNKWGKSTSLIKTWRLGGLSLGKWVTLCLAAWTPKTNVCWWQSNKRSESESVRSRADCHLVHFIAIIFKNLEMNLVVRLRVFHFIWEQETERDDMRLVTTVRRTRTDGDRKLRVRVSTDYGLK